MPLGTEAFSTSLNSGIMFINMTTMRKEWPGMLTHAVRKQFKFTMAEQAWMKLEGERDSPQPISHSLKNTKVPRGRTAAQHILESFDIGPSRRASQHGLTPRGACSGKITAVCGAAAARSHGYKQDVGSHGKPGQRLRSWLHNQEVESGTQPIGAPRLPRA